MKTKDYFNIPNLLGYFRIIMLPVFLLIYVRADSTGDYIIAFTALALSLLTDLIDGKIARKFNMVTNFGKALDPIADKLTQGVLAIALSFKYKYMFIFILVFAAKGLYMVLMGLYLYRKNHEVQGAKMFGKVSTVILDVCIFVLLLFTGIPEKTAFIMIVFMILSVTVTWLYYINYHISLIKKNRTKCENKDGTL